MPDEPRSHGQIVEGLAAILEPPISEDETPVEGEVEAPESFEEPDDVAQTDDDDGDDEVEDDAEPTETPDFELVLERHGEEYRVTDPAEAKELAQKGLHFSRTQREVAEQRKALEAQTAEFTQTRAQYVQALEVAAKFIEAPAGEPPAREAFPNVEAYYQARDVWEATQAQAGALRQEIQREQAELAQQAQANAQRFVEESEELTLSLIPQWRDQATRIQEAKAIEEYAISLGMTAETLQRNPWITTEPAFRVMARQAWLYSQASETGKGHVAAAKKTKDAAPGPGKEAKQAGSRRKEKQRREAVRARGGKVQDIAPLFERFIK